MSEFETAGIIAACTAAITAIIALIIRIMRKPRVYYNLLDIDTPHSQTISTSPDGSVNEELKGKSLIIQNRPCWILTTSEVGLTVHIRSSYPISHYKISTALLKSVDPDILSKNTRELNIVFPVFPPGGKVNIEVFSFNHYVLNSGKPIIASSDIIGTEGGYAKRDKSMKVLK